MHFPNPNLLVYIAKADAYAASCEYLKLPRDETTLKQALLFQGYVPHPTHDLTPGKYTDDTEMSAANVRVLIERKYPYGPLDFAESYVCEFHRGGKRKGYSGNFQTFLERIPSGEEFLKQIKPDSNKNGAAMRAVPMGVLPYVDWVLKTAALQASLTHDTLPGRFSARAVALMAHYAMYDPGPLADVGAYCLHYLPYEDARNYRDVFLDAWSDNRAVTGGEMPVAITTVHAVAHLVMTGKSLMDILERTLRMGGDTDSVAAIAWGIASCRFQEETLPEFLERDLENGNPYTGEAYLRDLGAKLMEKYR